MLYMYHNSPPPKATAIAQGEQLSRKTHGIHPGVGPGASPGEAGGAGPGPLFDCTGADEPAAVVAVEDRSGTVSPGAVSLAVKHKDGGI